MPYTPPLRIRDPGIGHLSRTALPENLGPSSQTNIP
jgi:hypothetical protein